MKIRTMISLLLLAALCGGGIGYAIANSRMWPITLQTAIAWDEIYLEQMETGKTDQLAHLLSDKIAQNIVGLDAAINSRAILHLWIPQPHSGPKWESLLLRANDRTATRRQEIEHLRDNSAVAKQRFIDTFQDALNQSGLSNQVIYDIQTSGDGVAIKYDKSAQQSVPGYPPQGVGSPEP